MLKPATMRTSKIPSPLLLLLLSVFIVLPCVSPTVLAVKTIVPNRVALFTTTSDNEAEKRCTSMKTALQHYQIPFDEIIIPREGINGSLPLQDPSTSEPKYSLVVLCVGQLSYGYPGGTWLSALTADQWTQMRNYERDHSVRRISFDLYPTAVPGIALANPNAPGCCPHGIDQPLRWYPNDTLVELGLTVNVADPPSFETKSLYHYPAVLAGDSNGTSIHPFLKFDALLPDYPTETVAAVVVIDQNREQMIFFMAFASWSATSAYLDDAWIQWGTRNTTYTGYGRKIEQQIQSSGTSDGISSSTSVVLAQHPTAAYMVVLLLAAISFLLV